MLALTILFVIITKTTSQPCQYEYSVELTNRSYEGVKYRDHEYFVDNNTRRERGCICLKKNCARKCCPLKQAYDVSVGGCVPEREESLHLPVYIGREPKPIEGFNATKNFYFLYGKMNCVKALNEKRLVWNDPHGSWRMLSDGEIYVEIPKSIPSEFIYGPDKYCIDTFVSKDEKPKLNIIICLVAKPEHNNHLLTSSCMLISCFFILLTLAVYACLPELRNLHGLVLMVYLLCFFVGFLLLATMQILSLRKNITQRICNVLTFIVYFFLLSAFFWLNVISYDIWWTFSGKRTHGLLGSPNKRFLHYAVYAFGVPTALTILLGALEFSGLPIQHPLMPKLRLQGCFLYGNTKLLYFYGPIMILCLANIIFFGLTAYEIWKIKRQTEVLRSVESSTHDQDRKKTQRFTLYVKLFTVMGINWILEVVSSFYPAGDFFWQFSDAYNVLIGLIIFIIFVCKKNTWRMIKNRYKQLRGEPMSRTQTTISTSIRTHSTSRDELIMNSINKSSSSQPEDVQY